MAMEYPGDPTAGRPNLLSGDANTLDEAKAAFGANIERFFGMAGWGEIGAADPFDEAPGG